MYISAAGKYFIQFTIPAGATLHLQEVKLELGSVATPFIPPEPAAELLRCQRYYQVRSAGDIDPIDLRPVMAGTPTVMQRSDGSYAYIAS